MAGGRSRGIACIPLERGPRALIVPPRGLGADQRGRTGDYHADGDEDDRDGAIEKPFESENFCERHDKRPLFSVDPGKGVETSDLDGA